MKILLAEDHLVTADILRRILEKWGHEVVHVSDGDKAWEAFDLEPARIIISDWTMPGLDGLELCAKVRARDKTEYTYFILLTAHAGSEDLKMAMDAGVDDFLTKPLDKDIILQRLKVAERILYFTSEIRTLKSLLPICMHCKRVRDDHDYWHGVETYIHEHTGTNFSHGVCPQCCESHYGVIVDAKSPF